MIKRGDIFHVGQVCIESGVYRLKETCKNNCPIESEEQREIPLTKGKKFPPCKTCKGDVSWEFVRRA